jgi:hypothetical protein
MVFVQVIVRSTDRLSQALHGSWWKTVYEATVAHAKALDWMYTDLLRYGGGPETSKALTSSFPRSYMESHYSFL